MVALALTLPLFLFLLATFLVPIAALLVRAVENPEVANALPHSAAALAQWDRKAEPPAAAFAAVAADLGALDEGSQAGALARRLNSEVPGARSLIATYCATGQERPPASATPSRASGRADGAGP
jgi:putative spermidine/putrescine transport system permease protein